MRKNKTRIAKKRTAKQKSFQHLDQTKRDRMEALLNTGEIQKNIAVILKVDPSTISRERKRNNGYYDADTAERKARKKRSNASYKGKKVGEKVSGTFFRSPY